MNKCFIGDCRDTMRYLIDKGVRVQTCVTSPPYWGLRDYGNAGQLGLEPTPDEYVSNMVDVFRLVGQMLADDGTLWLNLGDSYATSPCGSWNGGGKDFARPSHEYSIATSRKRSSIVSGLKPKDLCGIPWRVAFALQADGWYLRQDIIWSKPNPMPESVTDRCTKAHEYIFLLSKRASYYYDAAAIAEPVSDSPGAQAWRRIFDPAKQSKEAFLKETGMKGGNDGQRDAYATHRNRRSVWTVTTKPYAEAHFATFPPELIEPCILAGSKPGDIVLDPFFGSGTTGEVAQRLGRQWLGCELNEQYKALQDRRTAQQGMVLA